MTSVRPRRRLAPDVRRSELIDAAIRVLRDRGDATNRVAEVTAAAGAAKGTFYLYFPSWDAMLSAIRDRLTDEHTQPLRDLLNGSERIDWLDVLDAECRQFIDFMADLGRLHEPLFHSTGLGPIDDARSAVTLLSALIGAGVTAGVFRPVDPGTTATLLFAAAHEAADRVIQGEPREKWRHAVRDLLHHWLLPSPE